MSVNYDLNPQDSPEQVIDAARALHLSWRDALAEALDNSCDFGASRITISFAPGQVEIEDDGEGCPDPSFLLAPGRHGSPSNGRPRIGRYGVGGTEAFFNLAEEIDVSSRHQGQRRELAVVYQDLIRRKSWMVEGDDPQPDGRPSGVRILLRRLRMRLPNYQNLIEGLGTVYGPGISRGEFQIIVNTPTKKGLRVQAMPAPPMDAMRTVSIGLSRGRVLDMCAGIIDSPEHRSKQGVWVAYGYRVIRDRQRLGLGNRPTPGMYVFCQLRAGHWGLGRHKSTLSPKDEADIAAAIRGEFGDIIAASEKRGETIELAEVNEVLGGLSETAREILRQRVRRKNPPLTDIPDAEEHRGQGLRPYRPHSREKSLQSGLKALLGDCDQGGLGGLQVSPQELNPCDPLLSMGGDSIVILNTAHAAYAQYGAEVADWWGMAAVIFFADHAKQVREILIPEIRDANYGGLVSVLLHSYFRRRFTEKLAAPQTG